MLENSFQFIAFSLGGGKKMDAEGISCLKESLFKEQVVYGPFVPCSLLICFFPISFHGHKIRRRKPLQVA